MSISEKNYFESSFLFYSKIKFANNMHFSTFESAIDKLPKKLQIRKFCFKWRKIQVPKGDHAKGESHFFSHFKTV